MSVKSNLALLAAAVCAVALNFYQLQLNQELVAKISAAEKAGAKSRSRPNPVALHRTVITAGGGREEISLSILQAPGAPTLLRKVGNKFYPLTVDEIRADTPT